MKTSNWRIGTTLCLSLLVSLQFALASIACPTCGCNELCSVTLLDEVGGKPPADSLLSNSIWGNIILKLAYDRDPQLSKFKRTTRGVNAGAAATLAAAASGTLPQSVMSIYTLNPPDGVQDSYAPGIVGVVLEGATNLALLAQLGINRGIRNKVRARQQAIRDKVEAILHHLEFSETNCPDAQKQLSEIIGDKAAAECMDLWRSSHALASVPVTGG